MTLLETSQGQWPLDGTIFPVSEIDIEVSPEPHPFHLAEADRAAKRWQREIAANPHLFDGRMVLQRSGPDHGRAHQAASPYRSLFDLSLVAGKRERRARAIFFGMPMLVSSDAPLIAIRMGAHTANPGRVYSPGGSLEPEDIIDGRCDVAPTSAREVMEETGISLSEAIAEPGWHAIRMDGTLTVFPAFSDWRPRRRKSLPGGGACCCRSHPEIDEAVAIRGPEPTAHNIRRSFHPYLNGFLRVAACSRWREGTSRGHLPCAGPLALQGASGAAQQVLTRRRASADRIFVIRATRT